MRGCCVGGCYLWELMEDLGGFEGKGGEAGEGERVGGEAGDAAILALIVGHLHFVRQRTDW